MEPLPEAEAVSPLISFTDSRYTDRSTNTNQQRTMALIRTSDKSGYYVDIFRSDNKTRNDYMYHNIGNSIELLTMGGQPVRMSPAQIDLVGDDHPGFRHISDVKSSGKYADDVIAMFTMLNENSGTRYMKAYIPQNANLNYYTGYSPKARTAGRYSNLNVPTLMIQSKGEAWTNPFIVVYEPYFDKDGSAIQKVTSPDRNKDFVTLLVEGKNNEQQYIFQGNDASLENSSNNYSFKGYFGSVSLVNNQIRYIYLGQGKKISFGDYIIESTDENGAVNIDLSGDEIKISSNQPAEITVKNKGIKSVVLNSNDLAVTNMNSDIKFIVPAVKNGVLILK
jgi:hypothetical protein